MVELPKEVGDREYQSYEIAADGTVARKVTGSLFLTNSEGAKVDTEVYNKTTKLLTADLKTSRVLEEILLEIREMNKKLNIIVGLD